jgi:hypothetical protein
LHGVGARRIRRQPDVDTGKSFEQSGGRLDWGVDTRLNVGSSDTASIAIDEDSERKASGNFVKSKTDGGSARDRLRSREPEPGGKIPGGSMAARVIDSGQHLRQSDARKRQGHADNRQHLDECVTGAS